MSTGTDVAADDRRSTFDAVDALRTTAEIRRRAGELTERARAGDSPLFVVDDARIEDMVEVVATVTRARYPDLVIPFHSRWRHFEAGGRDRTAELDRRLGDVDAAGRARAQIDLALVSVLLDAGAGPDWSFVEPEGGQRFTRSEGLAVASVHAFFTGTFSADPDDPHRVDAAALRGLDLATIATAMNDTPTAPLVGLTGRLSLLHRLADALEAHPDVFIGGRPGGLFDSLISTEPLRAHHILSTLLTTLSPIWPTDNSIDGVPLGDCWHHRAVTGIGDSAGWMPFHKLSQWLTYSLLEPFAWAGHQVIGLDDLTALPEYRNGGLLLDTGVITPRTPQSMTRHHRPGDEFVVEWRALTVALLDEAAPLVAQRLGLDDDQLPLACVLEGGTWAAGRQLAGELRDGLPPFPIDSDGTVF